MMQSGHPLPNNPSDVGTAGHARLAAKFVVCKLNRQLIHALLASASPQQTQHLSARLMPHQSLGAGHFDNQVVAVLPAVFIEDLDRDGMCTGLEVIRQWRRPDMG